MSKVLFNNTRKNILKKTNEVSMKVLFFDTETNQFLPRNIDSLSINDVDLLPRIVQFSYIIYDFKKNMSRTCKVVDHIVKLPEKIGITQECVDIHRITKEMSVEKGIPIEHVMINFLYDIENVDFILGHNLEFDLKMVQFELQRLVNFNKKENDMNKVNYYLENMAKLRNYENYYCTMRENTEVCKIVRENSRGEYFKFPSLTELHEFCFKSSPENLHNSLNDVAIGLRCFGYLEYSRDICQEDSTIRELVQKLL